MPERNDVPDGQSVTASISGQPLPSPPTPPPPPPVDAAADVDISADRMRVKVVLSPPQNGGRAMTMEDLLIALKQKGVVAGILEDALLSMAENPKYNFTYLVAEGTPPVPGRPATLNYRIRLEKDLRPRENADGSVDYKDLGVVQNVMPGDVLCVKTPVVPGVPGVNVFGITIPAPAGKDVPLPVGKNTALSEDKLSLLAAISGQVDLAGGKIQVLNTFTVQGDVCNATGNINFLGNVTVSGNVLSGFTVTATGNIDINGAVEAAVVSAGGNVILRQGVNGLGKGLIKAGGYVRSKYIQSGTVQAGGDIETTFILNSNVQSGGVIRMVGSKATLVGGRATAFKSIEAVFVGGRNSPIPTTVEVGNDPSILARAREIPAEIESCGKDVANFERAISLFEQHDKAGRLTAEKLAALQKARSACDLLRERLRFLEEELAAAKEQLANYGYGTIRVQQTMYAGVRVIIGSEQMMLESPCDHCKFFRTEEKGVQFGPYA